MPKQLPRSTEVQKIVAANIRTIRGGTGVSQIDLVNLLRAEGYATSPGMWSLTERGLARIDVDLLVMLGRVLNINPVVLLRPMEVSYSTVHVVAPEPTS